jgi:hypothetical protein
MREVRCDQEGKFRVVAYPGPGVVTAFSFGYLRGIGAEKIPSLRAELQASVRLYPPYRFSLHTVSAVEEVDVPEGAKSVACELRLMKGESREVHVVGTDGQPQPGTEASGLMNQIENPMTKIDGDRFTVGNLYPGEALAVVARLVSKKLMGIATVDTQWHGPVTLRLLPWATLTGRLIDDQGRPRAKAVEIMLDDRKLPLHTINGRGYDRPIFPIEPDGRFRIEGLVAGAAYGLKVLEGGVQIIGGVAEGLVLKPDEARDLGDVQVRP